MIISHKKKFIYFACGKSGTTSVEQLLGKYHDGHDIMDRVENYLRPLRLKYNRPFTTKHARPEMVKKLIGDNAWDLYFKFTFVRNPWDWLVSQFCYNYEYLSRTLFKFEKQHFDAIWNLLKLHNQSLYTDNYYQYTFVYNEQGNKIIDHIASFENLEEEIKMLCAKIGLNTRKIPKLNLSAHKHYRELYTEETKLLVEQHYKRDIELFSYSY